MTDMQIVHVAQAVLIVTGGLIIGWGTGALTRLRTWLTTTDDTAPRRTDAPTGSARTTRRTQARTSKASVKPAPTAPYTFKVLPRHELLTLAATEPDAPDPNACRALEGFLAKVNRSREERQGLDLSEEQAIEQLQVAEQRGLAELQASLEQAADRPARPRADEPTRDTRLPTPARATVADAPSEPWTDTLPRLLAKSLRLWESLAEASLPDPLLEQAQDLVAELSRLQERAQSLSQHAERRAS